MKASLCDILKPSTRYIEQLRDEKCASCFPLSYSHHEPDTKLICAIKRLPWWKPSLPPSSHSCQHVRDCMSRERRRQDAAIGLRRQDGQMSDWQTANPSRPLIKLMTAAIILMGLCSLTSAGTNTHTHAQTNTHKQINSLEAQPEERSWPNDRERETSPFIQLTLNRTLKYLVCCDASCEDQSAINRNQSDIDGFKDWKHWEAFYSPKSMWNSRCHNAFWEM